ncbi:hypothetical protein PLUTE_a0880 [Pseudoalteromonas luteoviolacea DSM 6061]|nr:hypothetical protein [Pseudoalteromonas luteoviolacea DSM 6061]
MGYYQVVSHAGTDNRVREVNACNGLLSSPYTWDHLLVNSTLVPLQAPASRMR